MSDIRFNRWLHQSGTGGIYQDSSGNIGIGTSVPTSALDLGTGNIRSHNIHSTGIITSVAGFSGDVTGNLIGDVTGKVIGSSGINVTGVITATSFSGDGSALTGIDATALKDPDGSVIVQAESSGAVVTGILTATSFSGSGAVVTGVLTATSFSGSGANLTSIPDGIVTSAKIVDNSTYFDLNRKRLLLPRGHFVYGSDDPVPSGTNLNGHPYGEGFSWSGYYTISGHVANGATVTARNINNSPNGIIIIELSKADAAGGPYGNWVSGHEIWSVNTAHHGFTGGGATLIQSTGTLHGSYTTSGWYGIYITGSTGGTYYRVTFIN